jgi:uncharacterized protein
MTSPFITPNIARVLGALIEKEITTPEYYPMTLNALTNACNQKSNRHPTLTLSDGEVLQAFDEARTKGLTRTVEGSSARTTKYRQRFTEVLQLSAAQTAVMCELLLRGAQTPGELRSRAERMHGFTSLAEIETVLSELASDMHPAIIITQKPLVVRLPRQAGQKEARFAHTLCGEAEMQESASDSVVGVSGVSETVRSPQTEERIAVLEREITTLKNEVRVLQEAFVVLKQQVETGN